MKRRVLQSVTALLLSASLILEGPAAAFAGQAEPEGVIDAEEAVTAETVSQNETPTPAAPTVGKPASVLATVVDEDTIKLNWAAVSGADGYEVYSNTNGQGYVLHWTFDGGNTTEANVMSTKGASSDQKELNTASTYSFKVRAFIKQDGKNYYGDFSAETATVKPTRTANEWFLTSEPLSYKKILLTWKPVGGVTGYKVYISNKKNGKYKMLETSDAAGAMILKDAAGKNLSLAKTYYFKVQAYINDNGKEYVSELSGPVKAKTMLDKTEINYLSANGSDFVTLKWVKVPGADGYEVYRSKKKSKKGTLIAGGPKMKKLKKRKYVDKDTVPGQKYWYRVRAYKVINKRRYYSDFDLWPTAAATVLASTNFVKEGCVCEKPNVVKLTWSSVKRAKGYFVQRSTSENKGFTTVATVDGGNVTSTEIVQDNGTKYYYQIVCFSDKKKKKTWSYPCDPVLMTSNYFCYPSENYQERCNRVFGQDHYYAYGTQAEADTRMQGVAYTKWSVDPKKTSAGYSVNKADSFLVNKRVQPTVQQIVNEIQNTPVAGVNLKITEVSGYNFGSLYQEDREGVAVTIKVVGGTPGSVEYNSVVNVFAKYGFNRISNYGQTYDPYRFVYVGIH